MLIANKGSNLSAKFGTIRSGTVGTGATIYRGSLCAIRLIDGMLYTAVDDTTDAYKQVVVGWAQESKTAGQVCRYRADGELVVNMSGASSADVGKLGLIKDDETVQLYAANQCKVVAGRITSVVVDGEQVTINVAERPARVASGLYD